jgi:amino acid adenylation domain-containing protein
MDRSSALVPASIPDRFTAVALARPHAPALQGERRAFTYGALLAEARSIAGALAAHPSAERVALLGEHDAPIAAAALGALFAGRIYVPLDPSHPPARLAQILADADVGAFLADAPSRALAASIAGSIPLVSAHGEAPLPAVAPSSVAYLLYTSGSTGRPKGVVQSHENLVHHAETYAQSLALAPEDRLSLLPSLAVDAGLMDLFGALLAGASAHLWDLRVRGFAGLAAWLRERRITVLHATPTVFRHLVAEPGRGALPEVRRVVLGGELARASDLAAFRGAFAPDAVLVNGLGPTESTLALQAFFSAADPLIEDPVPIGRPVAATEVLLLDERGRPTDDREGELAIRSRHVALGYWRRPDLTAAAFFPDPDREGVRLYRTGDRARRLADGRFVFLGRADFQVKIRGHRVSLGEIEAHLAAFPEVTEAVVSARDAADGELVLVAHLVAAEGAAIDSAALLARLRAALPSPMIPTRLTIVAQLPLTPSGKIDRLALLASPLPPLLAAPASALRPIEAWIAALFRALLDVDDVNRESDFFALGGHSLTAARLVARLRADHGIDLPLLAVFEAPTLAALARRVEAALAAPARSPLPPLVRVPHASPLPLSFAEERLWFAEQLAPGDAAYHVPALLRFRGALALDRPALAGALQALVLRHEALRTTFPTVDGVPQRRIHATIALAIEPHSFPSSPSDPDHLAALRAFAEARVLPAFDLQAGPLLRADLITLAEDDHALLLVFHHLAADGWTVSLLLSELAALHDASRSGLPSPLAPLALQPADHAAWQRATLTGDRLAELLGYWTARLDGVTPLDLPHDRPRAVPSAPAASHPLAIPAPLAAALAALGRATSSTLATVALAGFALLLARLTGQSDLAVGVPVSGRPLAELEGLAGTFVNTVVVRITLDLAEDLRAFLARVRASALGAFAHDALPFDRLVSALHAPREPGRIPLVQAMLLVHTTPPPVITAAGVEAVPLDLPLGAALCDLTLSLRPGPEGITGSIVYDPSLFDAATIARYADHLLALLAAMPGSLAQRLRDLPDLGAEERRRVLVDLNATARPHDLRTPIHRRIAAQMERTPSAVAVISGDRSLSYAELDHASARVASSLQAAGLPRGSLVPILAGRSLDAVIAVLGVLRAGAAFVPFDPRWPALRLTASLASTGARVAVAAPSFAALPSLSGLAVVVPSLDDTASDPPDFLDQDRDPEAPIYAMLTSGSTGAPRLAVVPHRGIANRFAWMDEAFGARPPVTLQTTASTFDSAVWQTLWPLTRGGTAVIPPDEPALPTATLLDLVARHGITILDFVPSLFDLAIDDLLAASAQLATLRDVILGGEAIRRAPVARFQRAFPGIRVTNLYGPTEASIGCIAHCVDAAAEAEIPIGRPIANVSAILLDEAGRLTPIGAVGEIHLGGAAVGLGYHNDAEATRAAFLPSPFPELAATTLYRTGDRGRLRPDGALLFLGRRDDQIKVRGLRVEPLEIERALLDHPEVRDAGVLLDHQPPAPARLLAWIAPALPADLAAFARARLPEALVPSRFLAAPILPRSAAGKLDRRALAALAQPPETARGAAPASDLERRIAAIWSEVLGLAAVPVDRGFFDLGGHSLLAVRAHRLLERALGRTVPLIDLFAHPTIRALAHRLEEAEPPSLPSALDPAARAAALLRQRRRRGGDG